MPTSFDVINSILSTQPQFNKHGEPDAEPFRVWEITQRQDALEKKA